MLDGPKGPLQQSSLDQTYIGQLIRFNMATVGPVIPLWEGSNVSGRLSVRKVRPMISIQILTGHSKCIVDGIRTSRGAYCVPPPDGSRVPGDHDWAPKCWVLISPVHRKRIDTCLTGIRRENDL